MIHFDLYIKREIIILRFDYQNNLPFSQQNLSAEEFLDVSKLGAFSWF